MKDHKKHILREIIEALVIAVVLSLFIRTFVVQAFKIPSSSMEPTLLVGDHLLVSKFIYGIYSPVFRTKLISIKKPQRGDIIVFQFPKDPSKDFIKRAMAIEGDTVEIRDKKVFINGKPFNDYGVFRDPNIRHSGMSECRIYDCNRDNFGPVNVPENSVFVMGDNRDNSYDSRFWGFVNLDQIKGKAWRIYWSWNGNDSSVRWKRFGKVIE
ncbi:MAG: signal peptidase I [Thermodesulfobacteriota bacterium]